MLRRARGGAAAGLAALLLSLSALAAEPKSLRVCDDVEEPPSLNPYQVFSEKVHTVIQQILEGLVRFGPEGQIEPALAESWERIDDRTLRFHLRKGVQFHNGEPFDSRSVQFSIAKYVDPATHFPGAGFVGTIKEARIVDASTVDLVTREPDGLLLNRLAAWVHMVPPAYYERVGDAGFALKPVGTGAFEFQEREAGLSLTLKANPSYWMKGYPKLERLVFRFIPADRQLAEFISGGIDVLTEMPGTATLTVAKNPSARVVKKRAFYTLASSFNTRRGPTRDRKVRQALNYAIDRKELIRYDLLGNGLPLATLSMPGEEGFNPDLKPYPYDPQKARQLLREAGFPDGLKLKAFVKMTGERSARIIKAQWRRIGVDLEYEVKNEDPFMKEVKTADIDLAFGGCPDPMASVFFIQSISLFSKSPFSTVDSPEYDRMLLEMASTVDPEERVRRARRLDEYVREEALSIFTYQRIKTYGVRKGVDFQPYVTGMPYFFATDSLAAQAAR